MRLKFRCPFLIRRNHLHSAAFRAHTPFGAALGMELLMQGLGSIGIVAALVGALSVATASVSSGQNLTEADALNKKVNELYNAGKYAEATPLAQRLLAIREKNIRS
jgi:hypothetical protein